MKREPSGPSLSAVFVDYDNIYLSLKRRSEDAARRFAKDAAVWTREIESGRLITPTNSMASVHSRRIVMNRCYGNPVPRRNARDNTTDMNSFPFVRHHFLRAGFEVVDCPPLTAQLKNSSDIRMVMDVRDYLTHDTYFDEFVILSGDADFTPVLHRLRAHARRTVIFANEHTASPYTAICDGEIREDDLVTLLLEGRIGEPKMVAAQQNRLSSPEQQAEQRKEIVEQVVEAVQSAPAPVPIEALADKAQRTLGHDKTVGTNWGGSGTFRTFLTENLPQDIQLSEKAPYVAYDATRHAPPPADSQRVPVEPPSYGAQPVPRLAAGPAMRPQQQTLPPPIPQPVALQSKPQSVQQVPIQSQTQAQSPAQAPMGRKAGLSQQPLANLQKSIARIHEACHAPPLAPPEYRLLFEAMAAEITENGLAGAQTLTNVVGRAKARGLEPKREDVRYVLDVVSEADPWFEQGASANLFAGRFRNFVVARCRSQGIVLSADELDLIDAWFAGGPLGSAAGQRSPPAERPPVQQEVQVDRQWHMHEQRQQVAALPVAEPAYDPLAQDAGSMPRFVRGIRG